MDKWQVTVVKVKILHREPTVEPYTMSLSSIAYQIEDGNGEWLGITEVESTDFVSKEEAIDIAVELGNDGNWPIDHLLDEEDL
tara:strand:- start:161 stop:409 length:249 start_codon:yes stop_codon:yes gene_type:complete